MHIIPFLLDHLFEIQPDELHKEGLNKLIRNIHNVKKYTVNGITLIDDNRIVAIMGLNSYTGHVWMVTSSNHKKKAVAYFRLLRKWLDATNKKHGLLLATANNSVSERLHKALGYEYLAGITWCYNKNK